MGDAVEAGGSFGSRQQRDHRSRLSLIAKTWPLKHKTPSRGPFFPSRV
jgi:hypothetical protein